MLSLLEDNQYDIIEAFNSTSRSFFPRDVLDEIWDLIESVSEGFLFYSFLPILDICFLALVFFNQVCSSGSPGSKLAYSRGSGSSTKHKGKIFKNRLIQKQLV